MTAFATVCGAVCIACGTILLVIVTWNFVSDSLRERRKR